MNAYNGEEKRKHPRMKANFIVSYRIGENPEGRGLTQTKNISRGGMLLATNKVFEKGTCLVIVIKLPFVSRKIEVMGEVIASKEVIKNLLYETRVKLLDLDEDFFKRLGRFVEENLK